MGVKTLGEWNETGRLFNITRYQVQKAAEKALREAAEIYYREVIRLIEEGHYSWRPLTSRWIERKGHDDFFQFTQDFKNSITIRKVKGSWSGQKLFVGASPYRTHHSGMKMDNLARVLQFTYNRPLFEPAYQNVSREINQVLAKAGVDILK